MRLAAALVGLQGAAGLVAAVLYVVRGLGGADQRIVSGFGNAAWFAIMGAAVLAAAGALWTGRRWGRGLAVFTQLLILPVTWYAGVGSHRWPYAIPVAVLSVAILALLFSGAAIRWAQGDPASEASSGPDSR